MVPSSTDSFHFVAFSSSSSFSPSWQPREGVLGTSSWGASRTQGPRCAHLGAPPSGTPHLLQPAPSGGWALQGTRSGPCVRGSLEGGPLGLEGLPSAWANLSQSCFSSGLFPPSPPSSCFFFMGPCRGLKVLLPSPEPSLDPSAPDTSCRSSPVSGSGSLHTPPTHPSSSSSFVSLLSVRPMPPLPAAPPSALLWSPPLFCSGHPYLALVELPSWRHRKSNCPQHGTRPI